jgi:hypothetical protein
VWGVWVCLYGNIGVENIKEENMKSVNRFILDLHSAQSQISLPILLGDTAREWLISFSNGGEQFTLEDGTLAKIEIKRPTGTHLEKFCPITNNTTVVYEFDDTTAVVEGLHYITLLLYDARGKQVAAPNFAMVVSARAINSDDVNLTDEDLTIIDGIVAAEAVREANETTRINNEAGRVTAENGRVTAESARQTATTNAVSRVDNKIAEVNKKVTNGDFDGEDGYSPTISVNEIAGGYKLTIIDKNGTKSINIMNGTKGESGDDGSVMGYTASMELDHTTYKLTLNLKDDYGNIISTSTVDFPIENVVVSGDEVDGTITLTLVNGEKVSFYIGDLVAGLVKTGDLASYYNKTETQNLINNSIKSAITDALNTEVSDE